MIARAIKTSRITPRATTLFALLDKSINEMPERGILAITSKIVSLCEGSIVPLAGTDKEKLIQSEADYYLAKQDSKYDISFTISQNILIPNAGIDESNAGDVFVLWPRDPQVTANAVRDYLMKRFGLKEVGVVVTDSTCRPLHRGVSGIALAFSGFLPLKDYVGEPDLFGRPFTVAQADIVGGLASTAVMIMGEGSESTPLAVISDLDFVTFVARDPSPDELSGLSIPREEDLFAPFLTSVAWLPGSQRPQ